MLTDFQNSFTNTLSDKFATNSDLQIPHLKYVATGEWQQSKMRTVINDKSHGSAAKHLSWDGLLRYKFIIQIAGKRNSKIGEHMAKLQAKWLIASYAPFALHLPKSHRTRLINKITNVLWTETVTNCYVTRQINVSLLSTNIKLL